MQELKPIKEGKVREIYDNGDSLIMVATDRISCFDVILHNEVTKKGTVLTQMSKFWFDYTKDILPNHMISVDTKDMPEFFQQKKYDGKSMMCRKLQMLPIECIVRGYITGSGWASYQKNGTVCGIKLPDGLKGIIIADTKCEFGLDENGNMVLGDEMLTPDSSRFWPAEGYEAGHSQPSFDKQFARDWLTSHPGNDWTLPQEIVDKTIDKYLQAYKMLTGKEL